MLFCVYSVKWVRLSLMYLMYVLVVSEIPSQLLFEVWVKFCWIGGWAFRRIICFSIYIYPKIWKIPRTFDPSLPFEKCYHVQGILLKYFHLNRHHHYFTCFTWSLGHLAYVDFRHGSCDQSLWMWRRRLSVVVANNSRSERPPKTDLPLWGVLPCGHPFTLCFIANNKNKMVLHLRPLKLDSGRFLSCPDHTSACL